MPALILYTFAAFGLAYIVGYSGISYPIRSRLEPVEPVKRLGPALRGLLVELMECPACLGFWTGLAWAIYAAPAWAGWIESERMNWLVVALFTSGTNFFLGRVTGLIKG